MSTACHNISFFDMPDIPKVERKEFHSVKITNRDGSILFTARTITKRRSIVAVKDDTSHIKVPLTFKSAVWVATVGSLGVIAVVLGGAWTMYSHLDNKLDSYKTITEASVESSRAGLDAKIDSLGSETRAHFETSRVEAKADNAALSSQLQTISNTISELNGKMSKEKN